jgi:D-lactate dehydrogenase
MPTIAIFDTKPHEKQSLQKQLPGKKIFFTESVCDADLTNIKDCDAMSVFVSSKVSKEHIDALPKLKLIATRSTGYDHVDVAYAQSKGITVCNVPAYGENTVAEHTFALLLALTRLIPQSAQRVAMNNFSTDGITGTDIGGLTFGCIGGGKIGMHAIKYARGFGMNVLCYDVCQNHFMAQTLGFTYVDLPTLLAKSDVVSIHTPALPSTTHLLNMSTIKKMKKGAILLNTARGNVVELQALLYGLQKGIISRAGLDVIEYEELILKHTVPLPPEKQELQETIKKILSLPQVLFTPHNAFNTAQALGRITQTTIDNIVAYYKQKPQNCVKV